MMQSGARVVRFYPGLSSLIRSRLPFLGLARIVCQSQMRSVARGNASKPDHGRSTSSVQSSWRKGLKVAALAMGSLAVGVGLTLTVIVFPAMAREERKELQKRLQEGCPLDNNPHLKVGIERRKLADRDLQRYMESKKRQIQEYREHLDRVGGKHNPAAVQRFHKQMAELKETMRKETNRILYRIDNPDERDRYVDQYGCARWTEEALHVIAKYSPIIEIGAGRGQWESQLRLRGVDILAYDNFEALPGGVSLSLVGNVQRGDHRKLLEHSTRTLFLCYPPPYSEMAVQCLKLYKGEYVLYVGEGRGGCNANAEFFDLLERDWHCEDIIALNPFSECFEELYVFKRRRTE